jgi:molybdate transport system substrate-binding protein
MESATDARAVGQAIGFCGLPPGRRRKTIICPTTRIACAAICAALLCAGCGHGGEPGQLTVAAAADLQFALPEIARDFRGAHPETAVRINYGSSGNFYSQIRNGAPFDLFLSADIEYPHRLIAEGVGERDSFFIYATGRIVVWGRGDRLVPLGSARHIAIANPQHAPYGRAAEAALRSMGLYDSVENKLVLGENVMQTLAFVQSGAADVGIIALSLASAPPLRGQGSYWEIPAADYPKIEQGGMIVRPSRAARRFRAFLLAPEARSVLARYGFYPPGE